MVWLSLSRFVSFIICNMCVLAIKQCLDENAIRGGHSFIYKSITFQVRE